MRPMVVLVLSVGLGAALAGCLQGASMPVSSAASRDAADRAAAMWDPRAQLVGLAAMDPGPGGLDELREDLASAEERLREGREEGTLTDGEEAELRRDIALLRGVLEGGASDPGDGRAPVWVHLYEADGEGFMVLVGAAGVLDARAVPFDDKDDLFEGGPPLGEWTVDSVAAARAASAADETFAALQGDPNATSLALLVQDEGDDAGDADGGAEDEGDGGGPVWLLVISDGDGRGSIVLVDARTGEAASLAGLLSLMFGTRERGEDDGTFTAAIDGRASSRFALQRPHGALAVRLEVTPTPAVPFEATLTAPDGRRLQWHVAADAEVPANEAVVLGEPVAGNYTVDIAAPLAPYAQWDLTWCTDGTDGWWFPLWEFPWAQTACSDLP